MNKKALVLTTVAILALLIPSMITISPVKAKANRYVWPHWEVRGGLFYWVMEDWASPYLAVYYEEPVYLKYDVTNTWTNIVTPKGDIHQTSQQIGIVEIYGYGDDGTAHTGDDVLLDTRDFFCQETGVDIGMDNGGWDDTTQTWYIMPNWNKPPGPEQFEFLEHWTLKWKIQGLYLFKATCVDGLCVQCDRAHISHEWVHP